MFAVASTSSAGLNARSNASSAVAWDVASGTPLWTQTYNGSIGTGAYWSSVATDSMGNAYVTGVEASVAQGFNIVVRKYGPHGAVQWTQTANGSSLRLWLGGRRSRDCKPS